MYVGFQLKMLILANKQLVALYENVTTVTVVQ